MLLEERQTEHIWRLKFSGVQLTGEQAGSTFDLFSLYKLMGAASHSHAVQGEEKQPTRYFCSEMKQTTRAECKALFSNLEAETHIECEYVN